MPRRSKAYPKAPSVRPGYRSTYRPRRGKQNLKRFTALPKHANNRMGEQAYMDLEDNFTFYIDPKLSTDTGTPQQAVNISFNVNSLYPAIDQGAGGTYKWIEKTGNATCNSEQTITPYHLASVNPGTAYVTKGTTEQGAYAVSRKFEHGIVTGARMEVFAEPICGSAGIRPSQPGLLSIIPHGHVSPVDLNTTAEILKVLAPRVTKRVNNLVALADASAPASAVANQKARQVSLAYNFGIAKMNNVKDIMDNRDDFGFNFNADAITSEGQYANLAYHPVELQNATVSYIPALSSNMLGGPIATAPILLRVKIKKRLVLYKPIQHSMIPGVNFNLPKPHPLRSVHAGLGMLGMNMAAAGYKAYSQYRRHNYRARRR